MLRLNYVLCVGNRSLLRSNLLDATINVWHKVALVHSRHEKRGVGEEVLHLFKWALSSLGKEAVEENGVGQVAYLTFGQFSIDCEL